MTFSPQPQIERILDQAVSYYFAGLSIHHKKAEIEPGNTTTEHSDYSGAPYLVIHKPWIEDLSHVSGVLFAFSAELYLKAFSIIDNGKYKKTHDLLDLFNSLKPETKSKIVDFNEVEWRYEGILEDARDNFREVRYMHLDKIPGSKAVYVWGIHVCSPLHAYLLAITGMAERYALPNHQVGET